MAPSQAELDQVRRALNRLSESAVKDFRRVWDSLQTSDRMLIQKALVEGWVGIIEHYGDMAATLAADLFETQARDYGISPKLDVAAGVDPERATARLGWATSTPNQWGNARTLLDELVKQPYRSTFQDSAIASGAGWARVPGGSEPCSFCIMLASRGGVYRSKDIAEFGVSGKKYHGECHCTPILVRGPQDYPKGYDPDALYERYNLARSVAGPNVGDVLAEMDRQRVVTQNAATRNLAKLPSASNRVYWDKRQAALGIDTHGERLEPHEVTFVERMRERGESLEWIPRDQFNADGSMRSTNDFTWLSRGSVASELKSTSTKYSTISASIHKAVLGARAHGVTKDVFVVDLGARRISVKLRNQLAKYNERTNSTPDSSRATPIRELWVLSDDGKSLERVI